MIHPLLQTPATNSETKWWNAFCELCLHRKYLEHNIKGHRCSVSENTPQSEHTAGDHFLPLSHS